MTKSAAELRLVRWFSGLNGWPVPPDEAAAKVLEIIAQPDEPTMRELLEKALGSREQVAVVAQLLQNPTSEMFDALGAIDKVWADLDSRTVFTTMAGALAYPGVQLEEAGPDIVIDLPPDEMADANPNPTPE
jgi:hypothetical protein